MARSCASSKNLSGRKVLVVEDDYFIAQDTCSMLRNNGAEVLGPVASLEKALAVVASESEIDAAVLDINLRDARVFPVADALSARGVPFVFATGYDKTVIPDRFAGVRHCEKPIDYNDLMRAFRP